MEQEISKNERIRRDKALTASRIAEIRRERGLTLTKMGESIGLFGRRAASIKDWEEGKHSPDTMSVVAICRAFNVSADWLLGLTDEREQLKGGETSCL